MSKIRAFSTKIMKSIDWTRPEKTWCDFFLAHFYLTQGQAKKYEGFWLAAMQYRFHDHVYKKCNLLVEMVQLLVLHTEWCVTHSYFQLLSLKTYLSWTKKRGTITTIGNPARLCVNLKTFASRIIIEEHQNYPDILAKTSHEEPFKPVYYWEKTK